MRDLEKDPEDQVLRSALRRGSRWPGVVVGLGVLGGAGLALWRFYPDSRDTQTPVTSAPQGLDAGTLLPVAVDLAEGDRKLREWGTRLSPREGFTKWLGEADLIRRLTAAVNLICDGESPKPLLSFLEVSGPFEVEEQGGAGGGPPRRSRSAPPEAKVPEKLFISPASFGRYDRVTDTFTSVDFVAAGKAYAQLRPYFAGAFREIGREGKSFDPVLAGALNRLLSVKVPEEKLELLPKGALYTYADPKLEALSAAEKHLLRLGPKNAAAIQASLRSFLDASGLATAR